MGITYWQKLKQFTRGNLSPVNHRDTREIIRASSSVLVLKVTGFGLGYVFNWLLAYLYGAEVMGLYALTVTVASMLALVGRLGMETAAIRFVAERLIKQGQRGIRRVYRAMLSLVVPVSLGLCGLLVLAAPWVAHEVFDDTRLAGYLRVAAFMIPFMTFSAVNTASLQGLKKIQASFFFSTLFPSLSNTLVLLALTLLVGVHLKVPIYAHAIVVFAGGIISFGVLQNKISGSHILSGADARKDINKREMLSISLPMLVTSAMHFVMSWADLMMLGYFRDAGEVGVYNVAVKISIAVTFVLLSVNAILAPKLAEFHATGDYERFRFVVLLSTFIIAVLTIPLVIGIVLFSGQLLGLFGQEFLEGSRTLQVLCVAQLVAAIYGPTSYGLIMAGSEKIYRNIIVVAGLLNIVLNVFLIPKMGHFGAALATLISLLVICFLVFYVAGVKKMLAGKPS
ncbi:MAG: polysaccharide biosynthesis protein [Rhodothermaceae bacterium]|nr:MAG: polysaccharide biosynthesis protein [Rhodothermaceae bacterium]